MGRKTGGGPRSGENSQSRRPGPGRGLEGGGGGRGGGSKGWKITLPNGKSMTFDADGNNVSSGAGSTSRKQFADAIKKAKKAGAKVERIPQPYTTKQRKQQAIEGAKSKALLK